MAGQRQKRRGTTRGNRPSRGVTLVDGPGVPAPAPSTYDRDQAWPAPPLAMDDGPLREDVQQLWSDFGASSAGQAVDLESDRHMLERLFQVINERRIVEKEIVGARLVEDRGGAVRLNPLVPWERTLRVELTALAETFGMNTRSRFRLGIEGAGGGIGGAGAWERASAELDAASPHEPQEMPAEYAR